jgi:restriction system protein
MGRRRKGDGELMALLTAYPEFGFVLAGGIVAVGCWFLPSMWLYWVAIAGLFCAGSAAALLKAKSRRAFFDSRSSLQELQELKPQEFELFFKHLLEKMGYTVEHRGGSGDGGVDLVATKDGRSHLVQCKRYRGGPVGVAAVRDFYGAMMGEQGLAGALFVTTSSFTLDARQFAEGKPIELIDGERLVQYMRTTGAQPPAGEAATGTSPESKGSPAPHERSCPECGAALVLRTAGRGPKRGSQFWGCSGYPACRYTRSA